jgi:hypothetical protein
MISFSIERGAEPSGEANRLLYDESGRSFLATGSHRPAWHSILVNDLEIHVDAAGGVVSVDGFAPREAWLETDAEPPEPVHGAIRTQARPDIPQGSSVRLTRDPGAFPQHFNRSTGWLCVGERNAPPDSGTAAWIGPDTILVTSGVRLVAIWLRVRPSGAKSS